uniref:Uncharacterized protein n=1 Tax=Anguilla anguilla TaxID=7936 RepID=A0A0E9PHV0_ANGAN
MRVACFFGQTSTNSPWSCQA